MDSRFTKDEFITKSIKVHGDAYGYDNVVYVNDHSKIIITCPIHGNFEQLPTNHLRGKGCSKCSVDRNKEKFRSSTEKFISKAMIVHGSKYNYNKSNYCGAFSNVIIICPEHGDFERYELRSSRV